MTSMLRSLAVSKRVLLQIVRDRRTVGFIVVFPLIFVLLFGLAFGGEISNVKTAYINDDKPYFNSFISGELLIHLKADARVSLTDVTGSLSYEQAKDAVRLGEYSAVIYFKQNLTNNIIMQARSMPSQKGVIEVFTDNTNPQISAAVVQSVHDSVSYVLSSKSALDIQFLKMLDVDLRQIDYFAPGIIGFGVLVMTMILSLMIMIRERKEGTLGRVLTTQATKTDLVLGYLLGFGLIGLIVATIVLSGVIGFFNVVVQGSYLLVYLIAALFAESCIGIGIMLSAFARNEFQAVQFIPIIIFISIFLSGFLIPIESMPVWLQPVSYIVPLTYALDALREVMLRGTGIEAIYIDLLAFLVALGITMLAATRSMGRE